MYMLGLGRSFVPGGGETSISRLPFAGNRLTSDPLRYARNADAAAAVGPGAIGAPTVSWIHHAFRFMRRFTDPRFGLKVRIPTLIIAAGADPICATPATERLAVRLKAGRVIVIPGARHEILMERDEIREQFWAAFDAFIPGTSEESILPGRQPVAATAADEEPASAELKRMLLAPRLEPAAETDARLELAAEEFQGGGMDAAVAGRHDRAAAGR
jgi:lysophospholipase